MTITKVPEGITVVPEWDALEHWALQGLDVEALKSLRVMLDRQEIVGIVTSDNGRGWYVIPEGDERERIRARLDFIHGLDTSHSESKGWLN